MSLTMVEMIDRWPHIHIDQFNKIEKMQPETLDEFNRMCKDALDFWGWTHRINSDYRKGDTGQHGKGRAIDVIFHKERLGDVSEIEQFIFALKYKWTAIGAYPYWNTPGLHVDTRPERRLFWWRDKKKKYHYTFNYKDILKWTAV